MSRTAGTSAQLLALARANLRYWPTVAPIVRDELARWERRAESISDATARELAVAKLNRERFNPRLAATFATLAPREHRRCVTEAIVALQVAYDYVDAVTEGPGPEPGRAAESEALQRAFIDAVGLDRQPSCEDTYLSDLTAAVNQRLARLPGARAVERVLRQAAERCVHAQALGHAAPLAGDCELEAWARQQAHGTGLLWPEWLAGAQASVLCLHALIAAAADAYATQKQARQLDTLYLSIGALTMLDSLVDREEDLAAGEHGYLRHYANVEQMGRCLQALATQSARRARELPNAGHHLVTLAGVIALYASAPTAGEPSARSVFLRVRAGEPRGLIAPTLALMRAWRAGDRALGALGTI
jgi:hypothetical protein